MVSHRSNSSDLPGLCFHKGSGQGVVRLNGRDVYCGKFGTPDCEAKYHATIATWLANSRALPSRAEDKPANGATDATVNELAEAYLVFADGYYRKNGALTSEVRDIKLSIRPLRQLVGTLTVAEFNPASLKAVRQAMADSGLCRNEVNKRSRRLIRIFAWGVEEGIVPPQVHWGLKAIAALKEGRCSVRESEPVKPVPDAFVDAIRAHVPEQIWAMIQLQRLSGMRPQEVCSIRTIDIDMTGQTWCYMPERHKTEHHGKERRIPFGPQAREILSQWLRPELTSYLFSPREAMEWHYAERRKTRKSKVQPSQKDRHKAKRKRSPGERYNTRSYCHAVLYGIRKANRVLKQAGQNEIPHWHPNQLRHNAATRLRKAYDIDTARAVLGHSSPTVTEVYAERDWAKAADAVERIG